MCDVSIGLILHFTFHFLLNIKRDSHLKGIFLLALMSFFLGKLIEYKLSCLSFFVKKISSWRSSHVIKRTNPIQSLNLSIEIELLKRIHKKEYGARWTIIYIYNLYSQSKFYFNWEKWFFGVHWCICKCRVRPSLV